MAAEDNRNTETEPACPVSAFNDVRFLESGLLIHIEQPVFVICCALRDFDAEMIKDRAGSVHVDPAPVQFVRIEDGMSHAGRVVEDEIGRFGVLAVANADHPMPLNEVGF